MATITQDQFNEILKRAPASVTRDQLISSLQSRGHKVEVPVQQEQGNTSIFAPFQANTNESVGSAAAKTAGNLLPSAAKFVKGAAESLNPVTIIKNLVSIPKEFKNLLDLNGGDFGKSVADTVKQSPKAAYETLVPPAARHLLAGDIQAAQKAVIEDPVGSVAPFILTMKGIAERAGVGAEFDAAMKKVASPVTDTATKVKETITGSAEKTSKFAIGQATGLNPETVSTIIDNPKALGAALKERLSRKTLGQTVKGAIEDRLNQISETGSGYQAVRDAGGVANFAKGWLRQSLTKNGWIDETSGSFKQTKTSLLSKSERSALLEFQKTFAKKGALTAEEFLDGRKYLDKWSKWSMDATTEGRALFRQIRHEYNQIGSKQFSGLSELDKTYGAEREALSTVLKDYVAKTKDGTVVLKDGALNKIANAAGTGKDALLARLEKLVPDIKPQLQLLKAIEDIKNASGQKVGTYARAAGLGAGAVTLNPSLILASIISTPSIAVPLLRGLGMSMPKIRSIIKIIGAPGRALNAAPEAVKPAFMNSNDQQQ